MKVVRRICVLSCVLMMVLLLIACTSSTAPPASDCGAEGIGIIATATRQTDPDLFSPPVPPNGGDGVVYCPTPLPTATAVSDPPQQFVTTDVVNLSLDETNQDLAATAVGDDMLAVAWLSDGEIYVALSRGGNHFQVRPVDQGEAVSLAFSRANRLHVAYAQDGRILYRATDQGTHPADVDPIFVENGRNPHIVVDELNWAHVLYEQEGTIFSAKHLSGEAWLTQFVTHGRILGSHPFYNDQGANIFGMPSEQYWFGLFLAVADGHQIRLLRFLSWFNLWQQTAVFPLAPDEQLLGNVGLDYRAVDTDEAWVVASWVTKRPFPHPPMPPYSQPIFAAVNPLAPAQIGNPHHIYDGLNAVRWHSLDTPFDAGLMQTISVPDSAGMITFSAWGLVETAVADEMFLRMGIDPTGGNDPHSPDVVWSDVASSATFTRLHVTTPARGNNATLFLSGTLNGIGVPGTAVWDAAEIQFSTSSESSGTNLDFEAPFVLQDSILVPEGWRSWYQDSGNDPINGRDEYTLYAAWSDNGGRSWSGAEAITANRTLAEGTTGALGPGVMPLISMATELPSVSFFYIYETGDPPPLTTFLRYGRPYQTQCVLGTTDCTEAPGKPLLPPEVVRPSTQLRVTADSFNPDRAVLTWDALQTDVTHKDVYTTYLVLR